MRPTSNPCLAMWPFPACPNSKEPKLREHDYTAQFSLKHMAKDLRLSVETAQDLSFLLGQTEHLKEAYDQGRGRVEEL